MERLQKFLSHAGVASRRECEELIRQGRVSVDGRTITELGTVVDPARQAVKVDGVAVKRQAPVYFVLHKPRGVLCTTSEGERGRRAVDFAPRPVPGLHTVGRLDRESEGLVLLTNDGEFTERLTHPRREVPKIYRVLARGHVSNEAVAKMKAGLWLSDGRVRATAVRIVRVSPTGTLLEIELREGMNREIRRMLAKLGYKAKSLVRIGIGPLRLGKMAPGDVRPLSAEDVKGLLRSLEAPPPAKKPRPEKLKKEKPARGAAAPARPAPKPKPVAKPEVLVPLPDPPPEPVLPRPRYEPDEDGVIVVRRPGARFSEEEA